VKVDVGGNQTVVAVAVSVGGRGVWVGRGGSGVGEAKQPDRNTAAGKMMRARRKK
jgi:hypothetical protein